MEWNFVWASWLVCHLCFILFYIPQMRLKLAYAAKLLSFFEHSVQHQYIDRAFIRVESNSHIYMVFSYKLCPRNPRKVQALYAVMRCRRQQPKKVATVFVLVRYQPQTTLNEDQCWISKWTWSFADKVELKYMEKSPILNICQYYMT